MTTPTGDDRTVRAITLWFPPEWTAPPDEAVIGAADQQAMEWRDAMGLARTDAERAKWSLSMVRPAVYGCYSFPNGLAERQGTCAKFLLMWAIHDDQIEHTGVPADYPRRVSDAIRGLPAPDGLPDDRFLRCWRDLGDTFRDDGMSPRWLERIGSSMADWYRTPGRPALTRHGGQWPRSEDYWALRTVNSGMYPWLDLLEYAHARELTPAQRASPTVESVYRATCELYMCCNDLVSIGKDRADGLPNIVAALVREQDITYADAAGQLLDRHGAIVKDLIATFAAGGDGGSGGAGGAGGVAPELAWWLAEARHYQPGMANSHFLATRYEPVAPMPTGPPLHVRTNTFDPTTARRAGLRLSACR
ncbi:terpene synthase family protein [Streptomyces sp. NPDC093109]|uniref:terpene synthase family protein n=1 Tax=Streptomyces sp. NPDC093109 TaxID=3154977 RepID=UPI0034503A37